MSGAQIRRESESPLPGRGIHGTIEIHLSRPRSRESARWQFSQVVVALGRGWQLLSSTARIARFISRRGHRDYLPALGTAAAGEQILCAAFPDARVIIGARGR